MNPGPWVNHSRFVAEAAELIARADSRLDSKRAYVLGCLHDIGRRFGVSDMRHAINGYLFLSGLGHHQAARVCLTHSFPYKHVDAASGVWDCSVEDKRIVADFLSMCRYTAYDRLIQLCDALCTADGFCLIERRLVDVALRRGINEYTLRKWQAFRDVQQYFERRLGRSIYDLLPGATGGTFCEGSTR
jgi:hypothetical protein